MKKRVLALLLAALMVMSCTACGESAASTAETSAQSAASSAEGSTAETTTASGGYLNVMTEVEVASLDPQQATDGTSFEVIADYTDGLMQMDAEGSAVPAIAESYEVSEDGTTYTFKLREDAELVQQGIPLLPMTSFLAGSVLWIPMLPLEYSYMLSDIGQVVMLPRSSPVRSLWKSWASRLWMTRLWRFSSNVPVSYFL